MIRLQPVLEVHATAGFALWPVAESEGHALLPLDGTLGAAEVGTAVMCIAACNDVDPEQDGRPPRPADPLGSFLHGLLTMGDTYAAGGFRVVDTATGTTLLPGCCSGLEEWRGWLDVVDGGGATCFGHDPSPLVERLGKTVRLTVDADTEDSAVIELSVPELRRLLAAAERDLTDFLLAAARWAAAHLPDHAADVTAALARALDLPEPDVS
ncbi:hypothetical protein [Streptomyces sp. NPDC097619]|uniref:hypothetical protein n=1 Tax=Streptomyces sp. NPDC097619 TaxID=3157228 RepID=UPI00332A9304